MNEGVTIESKGVMQHIPSIAVIYREAFPLYTRSLLGQATCEAYFRAVQAHGSYRLLAALTKGEVAGFAVLHLDRLNPLGRGWLFHSLFAVVRFSLMNPLFVLGRAKERLLSFCEYRKKVSESAQEDDAAPEFLGTAYVDAIAVKGTFKRLGVGKRLIDACKEAARQKGLARLGLSVEADNGEALAFYGREGFTRMTDAPRGGLETLSCELAKREE